VRGIMNCKFFFTTLSFSNSLTDTSLSIFNHNSHLIFLLVYINDIIITRDNEHAINQFIKCLAAWFSLKDLGSLTYFLGVEVQPHSVGGMLLSQKRYILGLLRRTNMAYAKSTPTSLPPGCKLTLDMGVPLVDPTIYCAIIGSLQYLSLTRLMFVSL